MVEGENWKIAEWLLWGALRVWVKPEKNGVILGSAIRALNAMAWNKECRL